MPTRSRPELAALSLQCALDQNYPGRIEILIFDDDDDPSFYPPPPPRFRHAPSIVIRYFRHPREQFRTLGDKRNAMCEEAEGDFIAHLDSDDLSAPDRLSVQIGQLLFNPRYISGFHTLPFYDINTGAAYVYHMNSQYACGTTLVYSRDFWRSHPFPSVDVGEDLPYTTGNREARVTSCGRYEMVALLHDGNMSSAQQVRNHPEIFPQIAVDTLPKWFHEAAANVHPKK